MLHLFSICLMIGWLSITEANTRTSFPLYPILNATSFPDPIGDFHYGDIRARVRVNSSDIAPTTNQVNVQLFWRRRDLNPHVKSVCTILN